MPSAKKAKADQPITLARQLESILKSARDTMKKDKGLNGVLDRLSLLTWILFLKFLDDLEKVQEEVALLEGKDYLPIIDAPYRWRDWGTDSKAITGPDLIAFINQDEAVCPDGKQGLGLFAYLRSLESTDGKGRQEIITSIFWGVTNRMESGYLLRDVIDKVNNINFASSEEISIFSHLYESMLQKMRGAAKSSGEFYTPRSVVQFMVAAVAPQLGETVVDPACGTGGFLVEAYNYLSKQVKTTQDREVLQWMSVYGQEAKSLPYLLAQMNLLLHGLERPQIDYGNSLTVKLSELGLGDRVDVILTNPPFGGEEEVSVKSGFPSDLQTSETALLFLQLIMRLLKRPEQSQGKAGRAPMGRCLRMGSVLALRWRC